MPTRKIVTIVGARPQFIKMSPVSRALKNVNVQEYIVHTGQHYDERLSKVFFDELQLCRPNINLCVGSGSHGEQTSAMLVGAERILVEQKPNFVLVYGDTNSTLAGALAAAKLHIPVVHVEAGLRSFNRKMPEEINRVLVDVISAVLFVPTTQAKANLISEGVTESKIHYSGDVMYDAMLSFRDEALSKSKILNELGLIDNQYILATLHRAENVDDSARLRSIISSLETIALKYPVIVPLHPRARKQIYDFFGRAKGRIQFIDPIGFLGMIRLQCSASVIVTDSGGLQKEAFFNSKPCVTLRDETEWVELVDSGWNRLVNVLDTELVVSTILASVGSTGRPCAPYGDGTAALKIAQVLSNIAI